MDGLAVFVEGAAPHDLVRARVFRKKRQYAMARVTEIVEPSPDRVEPPCPYFGWCGGCKWQHMAYGRQLEQKRLHVAETLEHVAGLSQVVIHDTLASPEIFGYRNKMEFSVADHRWLLPQEMEQEDVDRSFACGLHVPGTFHKVLDVDACLLQPSEGNAILGFVKRLMRASGLPAYGLRSHQGFWRFVVLRHSHTHNRWLVNLVTAQDRNDVLQPMAREIMARFPAVASVVNNVTDRKSGVAVGDVEIPPGGRYRAGRTPGTVFL